ncbi:MAG: hypothetical protein A2521_00505 [Deltaproteobacteria bacterium RIFOXYD12_FULL_57_12]|nr:MAG: hypothetical protein A2521_00505 [Deltaproteobacteria bacterium RIFOXYD12_FULL_57_12]
MDCVHCYRAIPIDRASFREMCPHCGGDLHICLNCEFHDLQTHDQCRESITEPVFDKTRANLCEFFQQASTTRHVARPQSDARQQLEALFKK